MNSKQSFFSKAYGAYKLITNNLDGIEFLIEDDNEHYLKIPIDEADNCSIAVFIEGGDVVEGAYWASNEDVDRNIDVAADRWINVHDDITSGAATFTNLAGNFSAMNYIDTSISNKHLALKVQRASGTSDTTIVTLQIKYW